MEEYYRDYESWEDDEVSPSYISERKKYAKPGEHIPNKNEAKLLRKLMSDTGLTEKELREHKKYRKMLSEAQKAKGTKSEKERVMQTVMKSVTRELKLAKEHPKTKEAFAIKLEEYLKHRPYLKRRLGL
jgi:hypothetical protein